MITNEQLADLIPITATVLDGDPKNVCMTRVELLALVNAIAPPVAAGSTGAQVSIDREMNPTLYSFAKAWCKSTPGEVAGLAWDKMVAHIDAHAAQLVADALAGQAEDISILCGKNDILRKFAGEVEAEREEWQGRAEKAEADLAEVSDAFGIGTLARSQSTLMENLRNTMRFADLLHAVERKFLMAPGVPDDDYPDDKPAEVCLVNSWASTKTEYIEQFRVALAQVAGGQVPVPVRDSVIQALTNHRLLNMHEMEDDGPGAHFHLMNLLALDQRDESTQKQEIEAIADAVIRATPRPAPVAGPADEDDAQYSRHKERATWTTKQWAEHVGAWANKDNDQVTFGSWMALRAMLIQFQATTLYNTGRAAIATPPAISTSKGAPAEPQKGGA